MKFTLFSEVEFEVSYPAALIESYCFQSDFYANYDLPLMGKKGDERLDFVGRIGARTPEETLAKCRKIIGGVKTSGVFNYAIDEFLARDDLTMASLVKEAVRDVVHPLMRTKGIRLSTATKLLHTAYPNIIPMIDGMLQTAFSQTKLGRNWTQDDPGRILVAYYRNLKEQPSSRSLARVCDLVSKSGLRLSKVRVFDIIWWSYLKAKRLKESNGIEWTTIQG